MIPNNLFYFKGCSWLVMIAIFLAGCSRGAPSPTSTQATNAPVNHTPTFTESPPTPSPTPQPLAARVNGAGISLAEYQADLARYQHAAGHDLTDDDRKRVLDDLINRTLLEQAAAENGFTLDEAALQARLDNLARQIGGDQTLADWMKANGYSEAEFRQQLANSAAAAWMRDQILAKLPTTQEQVHVRQILVRTAEEANQMLARLQAGQDFLTLVKEVDPVTLGELGWFPRGYLFSPTLEEAAFKLESGQYSGVIETPAGFHILEMIERDPQRALDPQTRLVLQEKALQAWLAERRQQSQIEIISQ